MTSTCPCTYENLIGNFSLLAGDLIEVIHGIYSHWAVYIKFDKEHKVHYVVHLSGTLDDKKSAWRAIRRFSPYSISRSSMKKCSSVGSLVPTVQYDNLKDVVGNYLCRVNNDKDRMLRPFQAYEIVGRAMNELGKSQYNILFANCEHFVNYCRYGSKMSYQVDNVVSALVGVSVTALTESSPAGMIAGLAFSLSCKALNHYRNKLSRHLSSFDNLFARFEVFKSKKTNLLLDQQSHISSATNVPVALVLRIIIFLPIKGSSATVSHA
uniref:LRAT domain-containing protein n=1 Tax=Romanomermis culicivorax TaxID=13658 RepID=A0A915JXM1_ROMCU